MKKVICIFVIAVLVMFLKKHKYNSLERTIVGVWNLEGNDNPVIFKNNGSCKGWIDSDLYEINGDNLIIFDYSGYELVYHAEIITRNKIKLTRINDDDRLPQAKGHIKRIKVLPLYLLKQYIKRFKILRNF